MKTLKSKLAAGISGFCVLLTLGICPSTLHAAQKQEIRVCVTFDDAGTDQIKSDFARSGTHTYCHDRRANVSAFIGLGGQLRLDTGNNRQLYLNFTSQVSGGSPPFVDGYVEANLSTQEDESNAVPDDRFDLLAMPVNPSVSKPIGLLIGFYLPDGTRKWLRFEPTKCPGSDPVQVVRTSSSTWAISASPTTKACLTNPNSPVVLGIYNMAFIATMVK